MYKLVMKSKYLDNSNVRFSLSLIFRVIKEQGLLVIFDHKDPQRRSLSLQNFVLQECTQG